MEIPVVIGAVALVLLGILLVILVGITPPWERLLGGNILRAIVTALGLFLILLVLTSILVGLFVPKGGEVIPAVVSACVFFGILAFLVIAPIALVYIRRVRARQQALLWGLAVAGRRLLKEQANVHH